VNGSAPPVRRGADRSLFDSASGGSGEAFDWALVAGREDLPKAFLAGGIGPANARSAAAVGAYGLDVGSRVECAPGLKDPDKVAALFSALRPISRTTSC
jgi:indole-3-glycerol phosphate synthase/phosphoribosylanthranilate isomerase